MNLKQLGMHDFFKKQLKYHEDAMVGRIIFQSKELYKVMTENGEVLAKVSGKFRHEVTSVNDFPTVGDFVILEQSEFEQDQEIISHVLNRKSLISRLAAGTSNEKQLIAANVDYIFITMAMNLDFNLRRLERYLSMAWASGATPVVVLTKADLCGDLEERLAEVSSVAIDVDIVMTSSVWGMGISQIQDYLADHQTAAFVGSSGVGKSTIVNQLKGETILETQETRNDDKGRHTTTARYLFTLDKGGVVIDTPGMRELGIEDVDLAQTFNDIETLAEQCKFRDCQHQFEPGCAVRKAIECGEFSSERLKSYQKLQIESNYSGKNHKQIEEEKAERMFSEVGGMKNARKFLKQKRI
ncbi:MAG TPA: ribosome small subunit-dependent GTPase A [Firmicutes bacterium]|nr:ribosome small subunit-dependent GTPase A [Bacillota bacterium]